MYFEEAKRARPTSQQAYHRGYCSEVSSSIQARWLASLVYYTIDLLQAEEATPTAITPSRCTDIENANDQFIYITELWMALYYLELDLKQKRNCLQV